MPIVLHVPSWRKIRGYSPEALAERAGLSSATLCAIEGGDLDPPASMLGALATALEIPPGWLFYDPQAIRLLTADPDEDDAAQEADPLYDSPDPVTQRILQQAGPGRELFVLLTALLQHGDPSLLRAAEVNLRSLLKQVRAATLPWGSRPPGNFEPPSD